MTPPLALKAPVWAAFPSRARTMELCSSPLCLKEASAGLTHRQEAGRHAQVSPGPAVSHSCCFPPGLL